MRRFGLSIFSAVLLLSGLSVARANDPTAAWIKCLTDGENQGVSNKNCPAFERALDCQAQLLQFYEGGVKRIKGELAQVREERSSSRGAKRRELLAKAADKFEQAAADEEKAVAQSKEGDAILKREKHEAGCD